MSTKDLTKEQLFEQISTLQERIDSLEEAVATHNQIEKALSTSEKNLSVILEKNADGIVIVDMDGIVLYSNPAAEKLFAKRKEDFLGYNFGLPISADEKEVTLIIRKGEVLCDVEMRVVPIQWQKRPAFQLSVRDVTERKRVEEALREKSVDLSERVKELNCLYEISNLVQTPGISDDDFFQGVVDTIHPAFRYPEITVCRLIINKGSSS